MNIYSFFRLSYGMILWKVLMESRKAFRVYADFLKDFILLMIIVKALAPNDMMDLIDNGWTFGGTVSTKVFIRKLTKPLLLICRFYVIFVYPYLGLFFSTKKILLTN